MMNQKGKSEMETNVAGLAVRGRGRPPKALSLVPTRELAERAVVAEKYHQNATMCAVQAAGWAALAGLELVAARDACDEGKFESWVEGACSFGRATAYKYIQLSDELKKRLENEEACEKFMWLLDRTPSSLDKKQNTMLLGMMEKVTQGRTLSQLYFDCGITKRREVEAPAEAKPKRGPLTPAEQTDDAHTQLGKLVGILVMDVEGAGMHLYLKAERQILLNMAANLELVSTKYRQAAK